MAAQNSPFVEATYGWPYGSSGWDGDMNTNLVKFSYLHDRNIDAIVSSLPAIVNGKAYFNTADNRLYFDANGQRYSSVTPKWFEVTLRTTGQVYQFDGTALVTLPNPIAYTDSLRSDLAAPTIGAKLLAGQKAITATPGTVDGRLNDALPNGYGLAPGTSVHIIAGIDSLTAGAGGTSYTIHLAEILRANFGDSGPGFMAIDGANANNDGVYWGSTSANQVYDLAVDDPRRIRSFNFGGFTYELLDGVKTAGWGPERDWEAMRIFYLKQPGGGKFKVDHVNLSTSTYRYEIDTASATYELAYVDIVKKPAGTARLQFMPGSAAAPGVYGKVVVYGAMVTRAAGVGKPSVIISRQARGGHTVEQFADTLDATTQTQWFTLLNPTAYFMNGGTNDAGKPVPLTPEQLKTKFAAIFSRLPAGCKKVMIAPNMHSGDTDNVMPSYRPAIRDFAIANGYGYVNNAELIGLRARADSLGLMLDATHPNDAGQKVIARRVAEYLGVPNTIISSPKTTYIVTTEGGGPAVVQRMVALTQKEMSSLAADTDHIVYDLGLIGGFPTAMLDLDIFSSRQATLAVIKSKANARLRGEATGSNNFATGADFVVTTAYSSIPGGTPYTITLTMVQVGSVGATRVQIIARSTTTFNLVASGKVVLTQNTLTGQAVYEN